MIRPPTNTPADAIDAAAQVVRDGGVIAYPTEFCFALGCDPCNRDAVRRIFQIKRRPAEKGVILIADSFARLNRFVAYIPRAQLSAVRQSWPGPATWLLPAHARTTRWVRGEFAQIAVRVTAHARARRLCQAARMPLVSTSANRASQPELKNARAVANEFGDAVDFILSGNVGGATSASTIRDGSSGEVIRA